MSRKPGIHEVNFNLSDEEYWQLKRVCEHYRLSQRAYFRTHILAVVKEDLQKIAQEGQESELSDKAMGEKQDVSVSGFETVDRIMSDIL